MTELRDQFIIEARELVQQASDDLLAVERAGFDAEKIDRIFRAFHTLKGSAGVVDLAAMGLALHAAEDLLAAINSKKRSIDSAVINEALACLDRVSGWIDEFETRGALSIDAGQDALGIAERFRSLLSGAAPASAPRGADAAALPSWAADLLAKAPFGTARPNLAICYEPHAGCFFNGDDPLLLMRNIPGLSLLQVEAREPWPPLPEMDAYSCNLRIVALACSSREELMGVFRLVPDQIKVVDLPVAPVPARGGDARADLIAEIIAEQRQVLALPVKGDEFKGRAGSVARTVANVLRHAHRGELAGPLSDAAILTESQGAAAPLLDALAFIEEQLQPSATDAVAAERRDAAASHAGARSLRIEESKVDALSNLAGEMIVAKNGFALLVRKAETALGDHALVRDVRRERDTIERLIDEMHAAILQLRMVPVDQLFRSFPRMVRDIALRLDKKVSVSTRGGATECDKNIVERLFEPLMHLVRNAIDHGIERPDDRLKLGKPADATVTLEASRSGDRLVIAVSDDGRGIDPEVVRRKAAERGVMPASDIAKLTDEQAIQLVFAAGFSTAAEISDISGRGVGMDVVRAAVEQLGGRMTLDSRVGTGTTVRLELPVTIAMSRVMVVEAAGQAFGIPMDAVVETVRLTPDRISRFKDNEGFVLRDRVVPICTLAELMQLPAPREAASGPALVVVVEHGGRIAAVKVDSIKDRLDAVLKPMQGLLAGAQGYLGTTMTGDGKVLLILDLKEILP